MNIVFALGYEFSDAIPDGSITTVVSLFVGRSQEIILPHIYRKGNLEFVQALLLMCHYLQGIMELNEYWNLVGLMIWAAISIGLQLNLIILALLLWKLKSAKESGRVISSLIGP